MKRVYSANVETGRVLKGPFASNVNDHHGAFFITKNGVSLKIIVGDGSDWEAAGLPLPVWEHISVSCENRVPTWTEMCFVKQAFCDPEECWVQFHPPESRYVNTHQHVLHMWRIKDAAFPMPPMECV
jgi:hypothetical protein